MWITFAINVLTFIGLVVAWVTLFIVNRRMFKLVENILQSSTAQMEFLCVALRMKTNQPEPAKPEEPA